VTRPLPDWSEAVGAMIRAVAGTDPLLAIFGEQEFGTIILGLAQSPVHPDRLIFVATDVDDDNVSITLDRETVRQISDALTAWLAR
jgi:hypothetical protein